MTDGPHEGALGTLQQLRRKNPDITGAVIATADGFPVHSDCEAGVDVDSLAAMAADLAARVSRMVEELGQGRAQEMITHADNGYVLLARVNDEFTLAITAKADTSIGLLIIVLRKAATQLADQV